MARKSSEPVFVACKNCSGKETKHKVKYNHANPFYEYDGDLDRVECIQVVECAGCGSIKFRTFSEAPDPATGYADTHEYDVRTYPDASARVPGTAAEVLSNPNQNLVPPIVFKMYRETLSAFNSDILTLAGVGLRGNRRSGLPRSGNQEGSLGTQNRRACEIRSSHSRSGCVASRRALPRQRCCSRDGDARSPGSRGRPRDHRRIVEHHLRSFE